MLTIYRLVLAEWDGMATGGLGFQAALSLVMTKRPVNGSIDLTEAVPIGWNPHLVCPCCGRRIVVRSQVLSTSALFRRRYRPAEPHEPVG